MITKKIKYFVFAALPLLLSCCIGIKHLKKNEKLLYRQSIQAPPQIDIERLHSLYTEKANRKILGLPLSPLVGIYYWGAKHYSQDKYIKKRDAVEKKFDAKIAFATVQRKINNYQFRKQKKTDRLNKMIEDGNLRMQWGEPISVFDSTQVKLTTERFQDYLFSKGYFRNRVISREVTLGKLVSVSYRVEPGLPYYTDSIFYQVKDTSVLNLIKANNDASLIKKGQNYDEEKLTSERERIDLLLKDNGYYDFSRQYIEFKSDTSLLGKRRVTTIIIINNPSLRDYHKKFKVDSVIFTTDAGIKVRRGTIRNTEIHRNIEYKFYHDEYNLKVLSQRIFVLPGDLYNRTNSINTQRQLSNLDAFKFVNINYDTTRGKFTANIFTSPLDRYQWSNESGVNVTQGFPGPFYNISLRKRNVFRGLESFDLTGRFGFEGVASATSDHNIYKSTEAGVNASITFPQLLFPLPEATRYRFGKLNPKTKVLTGYSYTDRPEYRRSNISLSGTYTFQSKKTTQYSITFANLNLINSTIHSNKFDSLLNVQYKNGNNSLYNSFRPSFVNSIIFGVTWNPNNYGNLERNSLFVRAQFESGGTIWNFIDPKFITDAGLQYFKYLRLTLDLRRNHILDKNTVLAYRFNSGVAYSYGANKSLPYEKFFFAGGSNGIRAWRPRRLGPGTFKPNESTSPEKDGLYSYSIEQPADILLEGSIELRQKLFGFVNGAIFVDAGNVWTFDPRIKYVADPSAPNDNNKYIAVPNGNSQFNFDTFYKQIGVGTGFGLRFDFSFLIIRLDVGMKVYDPARDEGNRFILDRTRFFKPYATKNADGTYSNYREPVIYNFGIGYPF